MGLVGRKKSGRKLNGSKLNVPGQGISSVKPGGDNKINRHSVHKYFRKLNIVFRNVFASSYCESRYFPDNWTSSNYAGRIQH